MNPETNLLEDLAALSGDPYRFVLWGFPWGELGELENSSGPEPWQVVILQEIRDGLKTLDQAINEAVASGHGVGKSALVAWLILWGISTFEHTRGVVTANTETQLKTKTWAELGKWYRLFIGRDLFKLTATALFHPEHERTWRIDMVPWSERNTEAFAGLHNKGRRIILIFDEASAIPDVIHETAEGALTDRDTQIIWAMFGNPTRSTGRFREAFEREDSPWKTHRVDSRTVSFTNKKQIETWIRYYGEDSDFIRVRVLGTFPRAGTDEFIGLELVKEAMEREVEPNFYEPLIMGVDVARSLLGDDTVLYFRRARDGRTIAPIKMRPPNDRVDWGGMVAGRISEEAQRHGVDAIFVDYGGVGASVVDALRRLRVNHFAIEFGGKADRVAVEDEHSLYANKRAEMWGAMRKWLAHGAIVADTDLRDQLIGPKYGYNQRNEIQLERKEDMKKRGVSSPDIADALALTFAYPVMSRIQQQDAERRPSEPLIKSEYNPFSTEALAA